MTAADNSSPYRNISELVRLIDQFESCVLPAAEWNHRAHLSVAAWYLIHFGETEATDRMIGGIRRYNRTRSIGVTPRGGYHETLTLFWLAIARHYLAHDPGRRVLTKVNGLLRRYGNRRRLHLEYYSDARIWSADARNCWVAPDRKPLPGCPGQLLSRAASARR